MAAVPGLGRALSGEERNRLRAAIAKKKAEQVAAERRAQAAKDKASVAKDVSVAPKKSAYNTKQPTGGGRVIGRPPKYPGKKVRVGNTTVHTKTRTDTAVQGADTNERQRRRAAEALKARRENRPSRAAEPQAEKPKNPNYKPKPSKVDEERRKAGKLTGTTPNPDKGKVRAEDKGTTNKPRLDHSKPNPKLKGKSLADTPEYLQLEHKDAKPAQGKTKSKAIPTNKVPGLVRVPKPTAAKIGKAVGDRTTTTGHPPIVDPRPKVATSKKIPNIPGRKKKIPPYKPGGIAGMLPRI